MSDPTLRVPPFEHLPWKPAVPGSGWEPDDWDIDAELAVAALAGTPTRGFRFMVDAIQHVPGVLKTADVSRWITFIDGGKKLPGTDLPDDLAAHVIRDRSDAERLLAFKTIPAFVFRTVLANYPELADTALNTLRVPWNLVDNFVADIGPGGVMSEARRTLLSREAWRDHLYIADRRTPGDVLARIVLDVEKGAVRAQALEHPNLPGPAKQDLLDQAKSLPNFDSLVYRLTNPIYPSSKNRRDITRRQAASEPINSWLWGNLGDLIGVDNLATAESYCQALVGYLDPPERFASDPTFVEQFNRFRFHTQADLVRVLIDRTSFDWWNSQASDIQWMTEFETRFRRTARFGSGSWPQWLTELADTFNVPAGEQPGFPGAPVFQAAISHASTKQAASVWGDWILDAAEVAADQPADLDARVTALTSRDGWDRGVGSKTRKVLINQIRHPDQATPAPTQPKPATTPPPQPVTEPEPVGVPVDRERWRSLTEERTPTFPTPTPPSETPVPSVLQFALFEHLRWARSETGWEPDGWNLDHETSRRTSSRRVDRAFRFMVEAVHHIPDRLTSETVAGWVAYIRNRAQTPPTGDLPDTLADLVTANEDDVEDLLYRDGPPDFVFRQIRDRFPDLKSAARYEEQIPFRHVEAFCTDVPDFGQYFEDRGSRSQRQVPAALYVKAPDTPSDVLKSVAIDADSHVHDRVAAVNHPNLTVDHQLDVYTHWSTNLDTTKDLLRYLDDLTRTADTTQEPREPNLIDEYLWLHLEHTIRHGHINFWLKTRFVETLRPIDRIADIPVLWETLATLQLHQQVRVLKTLAEQVNQDWWQKHQPGRTWMDPLEKRLARTGRYQKLYEPTNTAAELIHYFGLGTITPLTADELAEPHHKAVFYSLGNNTTYVWVDWLLDMIDLANQTDNPPDTFNNQVAALLAIPGWDTGPGSQARKALAAQVGGEALQPQSS